MNRLNMTAEAWAQYLATYEPKTIEELNPYIDDLYKTGVVDRNQASINLQSLYRIKEAHPEWSLRLSNHIYTLENIDMPEQQRIRSGFYKGGRS